MEKTLKQIHLPEADWIGLRRVHQTVTLRHIQDGKPKTNLTELHAGVMVEVLYQGQFGYAATTRQDKEGICLAAQKALRQAKSSHRFGLCRFDQKVRPPSRGSYQSPCVKPLGSLTAGEINELLIRVCETLRVSPKIVQTNAWLQTVEEETLYVSSSGANIRQRFCRIVTDFSAVAQEGSLVQKRSDHGMTARCYQAGLEIFEEEGFWDRIQTVGEQALELLSAGECPTETTNLVLMPDQMILQIHESIGHPLEIDRILGDERNYAGASFVRPEDFGNLQYGSELLNITFDPTVQGEFASYAFDDLGQKAQRETLIRNGVLLRGLGSLESQVRSGLPGVANGRASLWRRPPIDRMANLNLEPGPSRFEEIVAGVEQGILMEANRSWSIDDYRNKFQFGCEFAKRIENGKITKTLKNPNYRGITQSFWKCLKKVGDASTVGLFGAPTCGKGEPNQLMGVGHASPVCLFENVEVFGGGR